MAYVNPNCPLPRNSTVPVTQCEAERAKKTVNDMESAVHQAYAASQQIATPQSFKQFGKPVALSAARAQSRLKAAAAVQLPQPETVRQALSGAPHVLPLNVSEAEYGSCCLRGTNALLPAVVPALALPMPQRAPAYFSDPANLGTPAVTSGGVGRPAAAALPVMYSEILHRGGMGSWGDMGTRGPQSRVAQTGVSWGALALFVAAAAGVFVASRD